MDRQRHFQDKAGSGNSGKSNSAADQDRGDPAGRHYTHGRSWNTQLFRRAARHRGLHLGLQRQGPDSGSRHGKRADGEHRTIFVTPCRRPPTRASYCAAPRPRPPSRQSRAPRRDRRARQV